MPAADVHEDKMRVAWGRLPFALGDEIACCVGLSELNIGWHGFLPAPWVGIIVRYPQADSIQLMQHFICTFRRNGRERKELMWRLSCLGKGVADSSGGRVKGSTDSSRHD